MVQGSKSSDIKSTTKAVDQETYPNDVLVNLN